MNELINDLHNKIDNQDKIINDQALEIAELNENITWWQNRFNAVARDNRELKEEKRKAKEYIELWHYRNDFRVNSFTKGVKEDLLEILGDKENE